MRSLIQTLSASTEASRGWLAAFITPVTVKYMAITRICGNLEPYRWMGLISSPTHCAGSLLSLIK
jgi:hypothetical protein